jgi:hypothetical protein
MILPSGHTFSMEERKETEWEKFARTGKVADYLAFKKAEKKECRRNVHKPS